MKYLCTKVCNYLRKCQVEIAANYMFACGDTKGAFELTRVLK
jgi:hypothetical protein